MVITIKPLQLHIKFCMKIDHKCKPNNFHVNRNFATTQNFKVIPYEFRVVGTYNVRGNYAQK